MTKHLGLKIVYSTEDLASGEVRLHAKIGVAIGTSSQSFITSPEIRKAIQQTNFSPGNEFGVIRIDYSNKNETLDWRSYYPLPRDGTEPLKEFAQKGIAARLETHIEKEA